VIVGLLRREAVQVREQLPGLGGPVQPRHHVRLVLVQKPFGVQIMRVEAAGGQVQSQHQIGVAEQQVEIGQQVRIDRG